ncbi:MAG: hypothetical protein QM811_11080 [Pirellulales bacterium]
MLGPFRISLHPRPNEWPATPDVLAAASFVIDFETVYERLEPLPGMFIEPDGSFVWRVPGAWQLDGHLYDRAGHLIYVDLLGTCPRSAFDDLLRRLNVAAENVVVQLRESGRYVHCRAFLDAAGRCE